MLGGVGGFSVILVILNDHSFMKGRFEVSEIVVYLQRRKKREGLRPVSRATGACQSPDTLDKVDRL